MTPISNSFSPSSAVAVTAILSPTLVKRNGSLRRLLRGRCKVPVVALAAHGGSFPVTGGV